MARAAKKARTGYYNVQRFIDAIPGSGGIISTIARRVGCEWHTANNYIRKYPTVQAAYNDEVESTLDEAEGVVLNAIHEDRDVTTAKWYLVMKGKHRGYTERQEISTQATVSIILDE